MVCSKKINFRISDMKSNKQYEDSARLTGYAMLGGILTLIGLMVYNLIVNGI